MAELTRKHEGRDLAERVGQRVLDIAVVLDEHLDAVVFIARDGQVNGQPAAPNRLVDAAEAVLVVYDDLGGYGRVVFLLEACMAQQHLLVDRSAS